MRSSVTLGISTLEDYHPDAGRCRRGLYCAGSRFALAHLAFCAAAILARPSALTFLRFRAGPRLSGAV
jgi:hypothetical protein